MHFLQSVYWKEIKSKLGNKTYQIDNYFFQTTKLPLVNKYVGYMPRPDLQKINWDKLIQKGKEAKCINIVIDPDNLENSVETKILSQLKNKGIKIEKAPQLQIHLQNNVEIDLTLSDEVLLQNMKQKHRYNLKLAQKKKVEVKIDNSEESFNLFLKLYKDTMLRQQYHGRNEHYLKTVWSVLRESGKTDNKNLVNIATAFYNNEPLVSWLLITFENTIYYPYGGSSDKDKNVMAPYQLVWEIIQWGKKNGYRKFDLFGIKDEDALVGASEHSNSGYSRFKIGFGGNKIKYEDTLNLIIDKNFYVIFKIASYLRKKLIFRA